VINLNEVADCAPRDEEHSSCGIVSTNLIGELYLHFLKNVHLMCGHMIQVLQSFPHQIALTAKRAFCFNLQEKAKKILDIWAKANTFPSSVLTGLTNVVKEAEKGACHDSNMCSLSISPTCVNPAFFGAHHNLRKLRIPTEISWFVFCVRI
jgi:hypothetical protein